MTNSFLIVVIDNKSYTNVLLLADYDCIKLHCKLSQHYNFHAMLKLRKSPKVGSGDQNCRAVIRYVTNTKSKRWAMVLNIHHVLSLNSE